MYASQTEVFDRLNPPRTPQIGTLQANKRWLVIEPHNLSSCVPTRLQVTVRQPSLKAVTYTRITLVPRKADLVAVLNADSQRVGYNDAVVLRAGGSYDPDRVQVGVFVKSITR